MQVPSHHLRYKQVPLVQPKLGALFVQSFSTNVPDFFGRNILALARVQCMCCVRIKKKLEKEKEKNAFG